MKIVVPTKRVPDTDQKIRVNSDGSGVDADHLPYIVNPFDAIALEEALRIRETASEPVEIVAVGIGSPDYEAPLRTTLAMGADRAIRVAGPEPLDPWNAARVLEAVVIREAPTLVLMGKQAVDDDANQTGQFLAALLNWPQATFASKIEFVDQGVRVGRETDRGIETMLVALPAVVTTDLRLNEPRYASLPSIMRAKKKTIEELPFHQLGVTLEPRIRIHAMEANLSNRKCIRVDDVEQLMVRLRDEAKVL